MKTVKIVILGCGLAGPVIAMAVPTFNLTTTSCEIIKLDGTEVTCPPAPNPNESLIYTFGPDPAPETYPINDYYSGIYNGDSDCQQITQKFQITIGSDGDQPESIDFSYDSYTNEMIYYYWYESPTAPVPDHKGGWILTSGNTYVLMLAVEQGCRGEGNLFTNPNVVENNQ